MCLALISDEKNWRNRLSHIFDIFKSTCTNEIFNEDIMLGLEVVLQALLSLWGATLKVETDRDELHTVTEEIAIAAFDKVSNIALNRHIISEACLYCTLDTVILIQILNCDE